MTKAIVLAVVAGMVLGRFCAADVAALGWIVENSGTLITAGLCLLLFFVGLDMGKDGTVFSDIKKAGLRILLFPFVGMAGTLLFAAAVSILLPYSLKEVVAIAAGFGWYSLAPILLAEYSPIISAVCFLANVMRELLAILLIPLVAKRLGYIESVALAGAAAMDTCLPITVKYTHERIAVYSVCSGVITSLAVPVIVPFLISL